MLSREGTASGAEGPFTGEECRLSDLDIRRALAADGGPLSGQPGSCAVSEARCWRGHVRADYVVASAESLLVVEIKSDRDRLRRLDEQVRVYSSIADRVLLVVGWTLAADALRAVPWWWEVWLAERPPDGAMRIVALRDGEENPRVDLYGLASMLPAVELNRLALREGMPSARLRRCELSRALAGRLPHSSLRAAVYEWLQRLSNRRASTSVA